MNIDDMTDKAADVAGDAVDAGKDAAAEGIDTVKDAAGDAVDKAKDVAGDVAEKAGEIGKSVLGGAAGFLNKAKDAVVAGAEKVVNKDLDGDGTIGG